MTVQEMKSGQHLFYQREYNGLQNLSPLEQGLDADSFGFSQQQFLQLLQLVLPEIMYAY